MDKLLIKYCKENKKVYIDYTNKFVEYNDETIDKIQELVNKKRFDDKYAKVIFRINFEKVNKKFVKIFENYFDNNDISNKSLFITRYLSSTHRNDIIINEFTVKSFFKNIKEDICCICLEGFEHRRISCCHCSAMYHVECVEDDNYLYVKDNELYCCICKNQI